MTDPLPENFGDPADLGAERGCRPLPKHVLPEWAAGDEPYGDSLELQEYPAQLLHFKICRSFRADLRHKLTIIMRAYGGYGDGGMKGASRALGTSIWSFQRWLRWQQFPEKRQLEKIDTIYAESVAVLVADRMRGKAKYAKTKK